MVQLGLKMAESNSHLKELTSEIIDLKVFLIWTISSLVEAIFLVFWVWVQSWVANFVNSLQLTGIDYWISIAIQYLFAISTLIPIATYIFVNNARKILHAWQAIKKVKRQVLVSDQLEGGS